MGFRRFPSLYFLIPLFSIYLNINSAIATTLNGRFVAISDGDTLTLLTTDNQQIKIRLAEIDTPERAQPFGTRAQQALSSMVFNKTVHIESSGPDRYGREIGRIYADGLDVNAEMIRQGMAWVYRNYLTDKSLLVIEAEAKSAKRGLWANTDPIPPWEWRRGEKTTTTASPPKTTSSVRSGGSGFACGSKRTCGQMSSCAEAKFYLQQCGIGRLDRDKDGIPCETLCR